MGNEAGKHCPGSLSICEVKRFAAPKERGKKIFRPWFVAILSSMAPTDMLPLQAVAKQSHGAVTESVVPTGHTPGMEKRQPRLDSYSFRDGSRLVEWDAHRNNRSRKAVKEDTFEPF